MGLAKYGKGDWRSISRNFVITRTPTQVASHAQKYFIRLNSQSRKDKRRASIHDITSPAPPEPSLLAYGMGHHMAAPGMGMMHVTPGGVAAGVPVMHPGALAHHRAMLQQRMGS